MNASISPKSFAVVASLIVAMMTGCAAGTEVDGAPEETAQVAQAAASGEAAVERKDPRSLNDRGPRQDRRSLKDLGAPVDPRSEVNLEVPAYEGQEVTPVFEAVTSPAQPGSEGHETISVESACAMKKGVWIADLGLCLPADDFAQLQGGQKR